MIEDSPIAAKIIERDLRQTLIVHWTMDCAGTLAEGLAALRSRHFDLVLLDLHLPDSEGLASFHAVQKMTDETPVVIVSGDEDEDMALTAVREGAQDYVVKGHAYSVILSRTIRFALERRRRLEVERELQLAKRVQDRMFPRCGPQIAGYDISGLTIPALETSGDLHDFIVPMPAISDDAVGIAVGDVSGHGLGPALVMAEVRMCLRALCMTEPDIAQVLNLTNKLLIREHSEHFVSMFFGYIQASTREFRYASAGHQGLLMRADGTFMELASTGIVLGIDKDADIQFGPSISLLPGDLIALLTDGIVETVSGEQNEMFGPARVREYLTGNRHLPASEIACGLCEAARGFAGGALQRDDVTAVIIRVTE